MNSEKEFKDNLKDKLNSKEFSFDESNWEQARNLIDASREEKKRPLLPFILFGLLFIGSGILGIYFLNGSESAINKGLAINSKTNNLSSTNFSEEVLISHVANEKQETLLGNEIKTEVVSEIKQAKTKETISKNKNVNKKDKKVNTSERKIKQVNYQEGKTAKIVAFTKNTQPEKIIAVVNSKEENKKTFENPEPKTEKVNEEKPIDVAATVPDVNNTEPVKDAEAETTTTTTDLVAETKPTLTAAIDSATKTIAAETLTRTPVHFISLEAGTNYLFGWNNPGKKDANGFNPVIGLNYANIIAKKTTLSFGIQYTMVRNLSYSSHLVSTTRYNFGEESDVMLFTPSTMHYLVAPIRLSYAVDQKNTFGIACNIGYLFNLNSNVEFYSQHAGQKSNSTILRTSGYMQGFKTFDTQLAVFYRRNLTKDLFLHTEFMYGLTDVKDNTFFNSNVKEKNIGLKLTLIYNLFKK